MTTLNRCERMVFDYIASIEEKHKIANPAVAQIMAVVPYSERHIQRALARMEEIGVIGVDRKRCKPLLGDDAPQRWTRPLSLAELDTELSGKKTLLISKGNVLTWQDMAPSIQVSVLSFRETNLRKYT